MFKNKHHYFLRYNLKFFEGGDKTEQPTARKRNKAREEGNVAKSSEVNTAFLFLAVFSALKSFAPWMYNSLMNLFYSSFSRISEANLIFNDNYNNKYIVDVFIQVIIIASPVFLISMVVGVITNVVQVGWHPTLKPLKPKFSKLNPMSGFKRLFSMQIFVELAKSILKFAVIGMAIYNSIKKEINVIPKFIDMDIFEAFQYIGKITVDLGVTVGGWFLFIAALDLFYTRWKHTKGLKMTKQEVKEEYKMIDGNPQIKAKIKQKMREVSMKRMMQDVPQADVIITNPTHYAVAIKYNRESSMAPIVVAKGVDFIAKRIKEKAKENNVEIVENKQLARTIYATVDIGREIPPELYQAVAEILAFVYKLKNKI